MSDEVVDRVMHRRGSAGLSWLEQPLRDERCEKTERRRFATRCVIGRKPWCHVTCKKLYNGFNHGR